MSHFLCSLPLSHFFPDCRRSCFRRRRLFCWWALFFFFNFLIDFMENFEYDEVCGLICSLCDRHWEAFSGSLFGQMPSAPRPSHLGTGSFLHLVFRRLMRMLYRFGFPSFPWDLRAIRWVPPPDACAEDHVHLFGPVALFPLSCVFEQTRPGGCDLFPPPNKSPFTSLLSFSRVACSPPH